ncbi:MAG TPA: MFS transporter [Acidimicrobiales bacterium]|nr:MFS transporter [Acidimicrobiales bacterium]
MGTDVAERVQLRRAWKILAVTGLTNLQVSMALSMIFVVFPDLEQSFPNSSSATLSWAVNIFTIVGAATLVLGSAVSHRFGAKQSLLAGTALFTFGSVAAAVAPGVGVLLACRVVQGLGTSLTIPSGAAIVFREFPVGRRGTAVATWSAVGAVGAALGPSLGGLLIEVGSWRWAFWLNLPLGAVAIVAGALVLPPTPARTDVRMPDAASSVLLFGGVGALVLALVQTPEWGWGDARTITALLGGIVLLALVIRRSVHHPRPLLQLNLFRHRRFGIGNVAMLILSISFFGFLLTSVVFLTNVWDYSIRRAGLLTTPVFAATAIMSVLAGRVGERVGYRAVMAAGGVLWATGMLWMAMGVSATPEPGTWLGAIVVIGLGSGLLWGSMLSVTISTLPLEAMSAGTGLNQTLQNLGNTLGVAIAVTVLGEVTVGDRTGFTGLWIASAIVTLAAVVAGSRARG